MSIFDEGRHPRGQAGKFTAKAKSGAGVSLEAEATTGLAPPGIATGALLESIYRDERDWDVETVALRDGWGDRDWEEYEDTRQRLDLEDARAAPRQLGGVTTQVMTADEDGAVLVQIDTDNLPAGGRVRIHLNDGPPVFDGSPERDEPPAERPLSPGDLESQAVILGLMQRERRIRWSPDGGETERSGTIRIGTHDQEGERQAFEDIRDSYLRVSTDIGVETTIPFTEAADLYASGLLTECG